MKAASVVDYSRLQRIRLLIHGILSVIHSMVVCYVLLCKSSQWPSSSDVVYYWWSAVCKIYRHGL